MKIRVLILCYDFPPLNTVGALRPENWYKELLEHEIFPVIITKKWPQEIQNSAQKFSGIESKTKIIDENFGTIIQAAYKPDLKSKIIAKYGFNKYSLLRRYLTLKGLLLGPFFKSHDELNFIYREAHNYLSQHNVDLIIATGSPFGLFKHAHILSKNFNTPWLADYRDPFTANATTSNSTFQNISNKLNTYLEKKWTKNAIHFTSASSSFVESIGKNISIKGTTIRNGYDSSLIPTINHEKGKLFIVTYLGTMYNSEYLNILKNGIKLFLKSSGSAKNKVKFQFVGIELNHTSGTDKILKLRDEFSNNIDIIPSCSNKEALLIAARSSVLLNLKYSVHASGNIPVKLYEYLALNKPIVNIKFSDEISEFDNYMKNVSNHVEFSKCLIDLYQIWDQNEPMKNDITKETLSKYTRSHQTKLLADLIKNLV